MRFSPDLLDDIRARLPVSDVVGRRVKLKRQGREYIGLSPFNAEKTPSFTVNDQKGFYHDFSSGAHGDIFRFVMETEGLSFPEAVEQLAQEAGVAMPAPDPQAERREEQRKGLQEVCEIAAGYFIDALATPAGEEARKYLAGRRLGPDTMREFQIGFAPNRRDGLKSHLAAHNVDEGQMIAAGLLIKPDDGRPAYDRFRNRIIIPIHDARGRVVAFGGRTLDPDGKPKYLNSPETELFHKGHMLFNAHRARQPAHDTSSALVVEGYMDAIAVWQTGIKAVVATLGTAFTEDQIAALWRLAPEPVICFDGDRAGVGAAHRAMDRILPALKSGYSFNFTFLPEGRDPDDLIQLEGRDAFVREIQKALPLSEVLWERETHAARFDTPERKAALEQRFEQLIADIGDSRVARRYRLSYRVRLSDLFWESERGDRSGADKGQAAVTAPDGDLAGLERIVLGLCVEYPDLFETMIERVAGVDFASDIFNQFKQELHRIISDLDGLSVATFYDRLDRRFFFVLKDVHGEEELGENGRVTQPRGHRLRGRLPVLKAHPPQTFVERLLGHLITRMEIRAMEQDLEDDVAAAGDELDAQSENRILALSRDLARRREEFSREEHELAEEAKILKSAYGDGEWAAGRAANQ